MPSPTIAINISTSGSLVAGSEFNLTCMVYELFTGLTGSPVATWTAANNAPPPRTVFPSSSTYETVAVLYINPLKTSYPPSYTCRGSYFSPADNITRTVEETMNIFIQIKTLVNYFLFSYVYIHKPLINTVFFWGGEEGGGKRGKKEGGDVFVNLLR